MRTRGVDHVGVTVSDLEDAIADLRRVGGELCYIEGPIIEPFPGWMKAKLGAREPAPLRVAAVNAFGANLELFEYEKAEGEPAPKPGTPGSFFLLLLTGDPTVVAGRLGVTGGPEGFDTTLPSGVHLAVRPGEGNRLCGGVFLSRAEIPAVEEDFERLFGLEPLRPAAAFGAEGTVFAAREGAELAVLTAEGDSARPANSDLGGHHVAFHADDVDASCDLLDALDGYRALGRPETITDGPIVGDRWIYVASPTGLQLELINMPDGDMPYETNALRTRTPIGERQ
ncbi:VOC family protein [Salininema proteolyticum]|uniref:VOC domain-containing protein n=1 Tax=Salininema proteolyticum TaxID=1607685 RepID=A0ABV8TY90_9ACTN